MTEDPDNNLNDGHSFDPSIQSERIAFEPAEMIACGQCGRLNPPNRLKCIYCVNDLELPEEIADSVDIKFRKLEPEERGSNIIFAGKVPDVQFDASKIAKLLSLDESDVELICNADFWAPLARVESGSETSVIVSRLLQLGITTKVIGDEVLAVDKPPVRLSRIDFSPGRLALKAFNTRLVTEIAVDDLELIIPGIVVAGKTDSIEKKGRHGKTKLIDATETSADEMIVDLYGGDARGFRVQLSGFDFSCLGDDKVLLAAENIRLLIGRLRTHAPKAKFVDNYAAIRPALSSIWEIEKRKDSKGLQRTGFGTREFANVATTSNLNQFTKYSRLQYQMYES